MGLVSSFRSFILVKLEVFQGEQNRGKGKGYVSCIYFV